MDNTFYLNFIYPCAVLCTHTLISLIQSEIGRKHRKSNQIQICIIIISFRNKNMVFPLNKICKNRKIYQNKFDLEDNLEHMHTFGCSLPLQTFFGYDIFYYNILHYELMFQFLLTHLKFLRLRRNLHYLFQ